MQTSRQSWARRKRRIRKKVSGTTERPRMTVYKSNKHTYVQVIDDINGTTLVSASTLSPELRDAAKGDKKTNGAKAVGKLAAERCLAAKVNAVVFDRNGYKYTGRVAAVADAVRDAGVRV